MGLERASRVTVLTPASTSRRAGHESVRRLVLQPIARLRVRPGVQPLVNGGLVVNGGLASVDGGDNIVGA